MSKAGTLSVFDLLVGATPRTHEVLDDGKVQRYTFTAPTVPVEMPVAHAMTFARIPEGFDVRDENGKKIEIRPIEPNGQTGQVELHADETIAKFSELKREALQARVAQIEGWESKLGRNAKNDELVAFLIEYGKPDMRRDAGDEDDLVEADGTGDE